MILISSCLIGNKVRYDGRDQFDSNLRRLIDEGKAISICPEVIGGLSVPRPPAEIVGGTGFDVWENKARVMTSQGEDVTEAFKRGAKATLELCREHNIDMVILKEGSPSCGSNYIYDGQFNGNKNAGVGVTTALLTNNGIKVLNEKNWMNHV